MDVFGGLCDWATSFLVMSLDGSNVTPIGGKKGGYSKRLSFSGTRHQTPQTANGTKDPGNGRVSIPHFIPTYNSLPTERRTL